MVGSVKKVHGLQETQARKQGELDVESGYSEGTVEVHFGFNPESPSTQYLRLLVPETIPLMVFRNKHLQYWVLRPSG